MYWENVNIVLFLVVHVSTGTQQSCKAPNGETGECISIANCPTLYEALANPQKEHVAYLKKFICVNNALTDEKTVFVCCGTNLNIEVESEQDFNEHHQLPDGKHCGFYNYLPNDTSIATHKFPWLATLSGADLGLRCGGALINNRYVLTTASCAIYEKSLNKDSEVVRLGHRNKGDCINTSLDKNNECGFEEFGIEKEIRHPFYDPLSRLNDIALLRLNRNVTFSDYIHPICLPPVDYILGQPNDTMYAAGLGTTMEVWTKKQIKITLLSNLDCEKKLRSIYKYSGRYKRPLTTSKVCAMWAIEENEESDCVYDAGGPIMFPHENQWYVEGILIRPFCYSLEPIVNTRVSKYLHWIQRNIQP